MIATNDIEKAICAQTGVTEEQFAAAKAKRAATVAAPAVKDRAGFISINSDDDAGDGLTECCRDASMAHLEGHRSAIDRAISRRSDSSAHHGIRFVR